MPVGSNGSDALFFQGTLGHLTLTLINPYTGESVLLDDDYNINNTTYDGLNGTDILLMTDFGDAIFLEGTNGTILVKNVEIFSAGNGGDAIILSSFIHSLNNVVIDGGLGNDVLWSNNGNDVISASDGDDIVNGGGGVDTINGGDGNDTLRGADGNDTMSGDAGNDVLYGGAGADRLNGNDGNDILYGGNNDAFVLVDKDFHDPIAFPGLREGVNIVNLVPPGDPSLGVADGNLDINFDATATITFRQGFAGYNNSLGVYSVAADGTIQGASILWANVKTAGIDVTHTVDLPTGENGGSLGFFIIADGNSVNNGYSGLDITGDGVIRFVYDYGLVTERDAKVTDAASHVKIVYDDGVTVRVLNGDDYHTTDRGGSNSINGDNKVHIVSGLASTGDDDALRIGFEDLRYTGDADYEDVLFDLNINGVSHDVSEVGDDILNGGAGDDTFYGEAGNDILIVGLGADRIYGGAGSDTIAYNVLDSLVDIIFGFETGVGGDHLNLSALLQGFDSGDTISDFVQLATVAGGTEVRVNSDGDAGGAFTTIALIDGGVSGTLNDLLAQGNIVLNSPVSV